MAGGATEQREAPFESPLSAPPKVFLAAGSGGGVSGGSSPVAAEAAAVISPTSTLQAAAGSPTSPAAAAVPFSRRSPPSVKRHRCHRPAWEGTPAGLGLAGALNGDAAPPAATVLTGQSFRSPALAAAGSPTSPAADRSARSSNSSLGRRQCLMSPGEMEASEDYTRVIAREGPYPRTTHIFDDRVLVDGVGVGEDGAFLRWCHGCSKDLGLGKDIFMYRGEMAFCSHECRYREMLLLDEES